ncbi:MAG: hypothetical protein KatS3mg005_2064 [Bryobacteraceae bacterium]|nr:MAG: hypothetical protein KatS3mg005_2064 [Bryobacteraceae bacterium]
MLTKLRYIKLQPNRSLKKRPRGAENCSVFRFPPKRKPWERIAPLPTRLPAAIGRPPEGCFRAPQAVAAAIRFLILTRLYAAAASVNSHPTFSRPLSFTFLSPATTFAHPKNSSTSFRLLWLIQ